MYQACTYLDKKQFSKTCIILIFIPYLNLLCGILGKYITVPPQPIVYFTKGKYLE